MKILALDASGTSASAALAEDDILIAEYTINTKKTHSQILLPLVAGIREMTGMDLSDIDAIAVAEGPGSFTGLRIGSATAKGLGLVWEKPIVPVPTVNGLAMNLWGCATHICPMMDARRSQVYTGLFHFAQEELVTDIEQCALSVEEILARINDKGDPVTFLGDGVPVYMKQIREGCKVPFRFAPAHMNRQKAGSVAVLGMQLFARGIRQTPEEHSPVYLRASQAEQEGTKEYNRLETKN
ncbi:MAG: tRNA (adenosine(37)-N6)-threonylcarbamoyltransferase complex dimerization subunit type 1 TsaB [Lachnospiraceae bacterium]|nr:tRNA (adenosine(37)-N6)-threonylcarbamoyltransferase complex dimerization subunit type 1 TsaB [Lachnospiraceae bacterium]